MLVVSLLAMSQTLRSHSSTCDSEIRTITGHARNSFRAQVLLKPVFHLGLIDLVAREGEYSERSESLLNNRPVVLWVCTWHLHVALFIPWPFFVPEGKPPTSNLSLRQNVWLRPSSRGRVVAEPMLSRGKAGGAHVPAAQLAGFYNNAHCELLPLQHTLAVAERSFIYFGRAPGEQPTPRFRIGDTMTRSGLHVPHGTMAVATPRFRGLEIGENSLTASKPHSCTSFLNGFSSDPVCAVTPAPEVVFFQAGPLCLRLPMTITPTLGPLCDFSAYLLVYVPAPRVFS
ncbi:hypothetical protein PAPYR_12658 [Paratrimastix pyriformis]|uniref:Uncharacterized protein n=1 Tax=Paratrimastix pyriformis TaxID=342808 RepID=A0ABQ8U1I8_9EUKA|nr:hypothetical protein PAPYR_12658 [Paratrimastix pyriformis]